jgi:formylglycine-generating enzyme
VTDPQGPSSAQYRVIRGGDWEGGAWFCRSAYRGVGFPSSGSGLLGLRVVLAPGQP